MVFGGAHAGARDLLSCCKRLDAPPQMTQDEALAGECEGAKCWASVYPLYRAANCTALLIISLPGSQGAGGRGQQETREQAPVRYSKRLLGLRHGNILVRARSQIRLTETLWRHEQEQLDLAYSCPLLSKELARPGAQAGMVEEMRCVSVCMWVRGVHGAQQGAQGFTVCLDDGAGSQLLASQPASSRIREFGQVAEGLVEL